MSQMYRDPNSGRYYYVDQLTGESRWADDVAIQPATQVATYSAGLERQARQMPSTGFRFDGGAGSYLGVGLLAFAITLVTLGLLAPLGMVLLYRWRTEHTLIDGNRLRFTGTAMGLLGHWLKWWLLMIVTLGIYAFWVVPRLTRWTIEHQAITYVRAL